MQNSINKNYPLKNIKPKNKKMTSNKLEEKGDKKRPRKKLALLGLNKPNSTRNPQLLNLNLSENIGINIKVNKNNNLIKSSDISINTNKKETNKKNKIQIFRTDKVIPIHNQNNNVKIIQRDKSKKKENKTQKSDYFFLDFNFQNNQENISYAGEYLEEIYMNGYMANQPEINEIMRAILIDWIIDVHLRFNLRQDTLFMTIWLIDAYLSFALVQRDKLQLLGITCLLISGKAHEIYYPQHNKLLEMTDNAYIKEEMLTMENEILKKLNFFIVCPNPIDFYNILSKMFNFEKKQYYLGNYFIEAALINYPILKYSSSVIASSCAYLVMKYYKINGYQKLYNNFIVNEKCPEDVIKDAAKEIYFLVGNLSKSKFKSVKKKFSLTQFENVSEIL